MKFNKIKQQIKASSSRSLKKRTKLLFKFPKFMYLSYNIVPPFLKNESLGLKKSSISNLASNEVATISLFNHWLRVYTVTKY